MLCLSRRYRCAAQYSPLDFSGWLKTYLGGKWHTMNARHNHPRIWRLLIAHGRDATDAAISTAFGNASSSASTSSQRKYIWRRLAGQFQREILDVWVQLVHVPVLQQLAGDQFQSGFEG